MRITSLLLAAGLVTVAGCGSVGEPSGPTVAGVQTAPAMPTAVPAATGLVRSAGLVTILGQGDQAAELCLGGVAESYPPQCGGPQIVGWTWSEHPRTFEQANGVRWGTYAVTGRFDGTRFTLTEAISGALYDPIAAPEEPGTKTPCPEPDGGWKVLDPERTTAETMDQTFAAASGLPGYADAWMDQSRNLADGTGDDEAMNDPEFTTINVRVTEDVAGAEKALREIWGGALCVTKADRTEAELLEIQTVLGDLPGMLTSTPSNGRVEAQVIHDDGSLQEWADATYGMGLVVISSALVRIAD